MVSGGKLKHPVTHCSEKKTKWKERTQRENERTDSKYNEDKGSDEALGSILAQENGEGKDTISSVSSNVFKIFDRNDSKVGEEQEGRDRDWQCANILLR